MNHTTAANLSQLQAVETTEGPILIIAGPGSGKTFTLVERVVYLITQKNVNPDSLFVVTFTEKAAQELTTRISNRLNQIGVRFNLNEMYLGTFHSICLRFLEENREYTRLKRNFIMMDAFDQQFFVYKNLSEYEEIEDIELLAGEKGSAWSQTETLVKWINAVSEEALDHQRLIDASDPEVRVLGQCAALYHRQLEEANALDFSTIQYEALKLLRNNPAVRDALRKKITYFMVDEYQDTNTIQELILVELAGEDKPNLCVVGDDDQGLYRFRGATIRNILQFKDRFPEGVCKQVNLTVNYRSHPDIIDYYNKWMADQQWEHGGQSFRFSKNITPKDDVVFPDVPTVIKITSDEQAVFHREVLTFLHELKDKGRLTDWNQVAFLFRSVKNHKAVALSRFLETNGIPVYSPRSNQFFEREEIRMMIGALIFLFPQFPDIRQWRSDVRLNIWEYYDNDCYSLFAEQLRKPENADLLKWCRLLARQHMVLSQNTDYSFGGLFYRLLQFPLFSRYLEDDLLTGGIQDSRAMRNLALFSQLLGKFEYLNNISVITPEYLEKNLKDLFNQFLRFLKDGGIDEYEDQQEYAPSGCVSFFTVHQSKGLEFPVVVVGSLDATPRKQYSRLDEILENGYLTRPPFEPLEQTKFYDFRRLFYTAFSRAQNLLVLAYHEIEGHGRTPSKHFADYVNTLPSWHSPLFKPENLPLADIKEINLKTEYSFTSHLTLFENCAEQYRFYRELEFSPIRTNPILFGTLVHQTIEDIHKTVLKGEDHKLSTEQVTAWFDTNYIYLTKRERVYLASYVKKIALEQVLRYYKRNEGDWSHIKECEVDVSLVKDEYILKGTIDLVTGDNQTVELVDFKSEKKLDVNSPEDREKLDRYRRQLEVYAHIVEERTGHQVSKTHLYYTSEEMGSPYITFPKDNKAIEKTIATFDAVVHRIEQKDFSIAERPHNLCPSCDMRFYCDRKNWKFRRTS